MAIQSQPNRIPEPFAESGTKNGIPATNSTPSASQAASWASGFPPECSQPISAGGCPVPRNDFNGVLNQLSQDYAFRQDGGVWEWSSSADYDVHRVVRGSDGVLYMSIAQSGPSVVAGAKNPVNDSTHSYWSPMPSDDSDLVHKSGNESISGEKTFSVKMYVKEIVATDSGALHRNTDSGLMSLAGGSSGFSGALLDLNGPTRASGAGHFNLHAADGVDDVNLNGRPDGTLYWNGQAVQTSSDERIKTPLSSVPEAVLDAWEAVGWGQFQFLDAVARKGGSARLHLGLIAQRVKAVFEERGLDACEYGILCHEEREALDGRPAVDLWMVRYTEALAMEACCQRRRADRAEARLEALEERLAAIEAKLSS